MHWKCAIWMTGIQGGMLSCRNGIKLPCCPDTKECREKAETIERFLQTIQTCHDEHWIPQCRRMESKYWKYINFVGHMENLKCDMKRRLDQIGTWEAWGATGWGPESNRSILEISEHSQSHTTSADSKLEQWYTLTTHCSVSKRPT